MVMEFDRLMKAYTVMESDGLRKAPRPGVPIPTKSNSWLGALLHSDGIWWIEEGAKAWCADSNKVKQLVGCVTTRWWNVMDWGRPQGLVCRFQQSPTAGRVRYYTVMESDGIWWNLMESDGLRKAPRAWCANSNKVQQLVGCVTTRWWNLMDWGRRQGLVCRFQQSPTAGGWLCYWEVLTFQLYSCTFSGQVTILDPNVHTGAFWLFFTVIFTVQDNAFTSQKQSTHFDL